MLGNFSCFFQNKLFRNTIRMSNFLDPDQAQHFVGPDLGQAQHLVGPDPGPNCLKKINQSFMFFLAQMHIPNFSVGLGRGLGTLENSV